MRRHQSVESQVLKPFNTSKEPITVAANTTTNSQTTTTSVSKTIIPTIKNDTPKSEANTNVEKRPERISIRKSISSQEHSVQSQEIKTDMPADSKRQHPFNKEDLERVWITIPREVEGDGRQKAALMNALPELDGTKVILSFNNILQVQNMSPIMPTIAKLLADKLQNDYIEIVTKIEEVQKRNEFMSVGERYNHLSSRNTELKNLKNLLDLQFA